MANVKISELPSLSAIDSDDALIVNDTSENTTKRANVSALSSVVNATVTPASGITVNSGTITMTVRKYAFGINVVSFLFANVNLTASANTDITFTHNAQSMGSLGGATSNFSARSDPINSLLPDSNSYADIAGCEAFITGNVIRITTKVRSGGTIIATAPVAIKADTVVVLNGNYNLITVSSW